MERGAGTSLRTIPVAPTTESLEPIHWSLITDRDSIASTLIYDAFAVNDEASYGSEFGS